jgi:hypothetical protein
LTLLLTLLRHYWHYFIIIVLAQPLWLIDYWHYYCHIID